MSDIRDRIIDGYLGALDDLESLFSAGHPHPDSMLSALIAIVRTMAAERDAAILRAVKAEADAVSLQTKISEAERVMDALREETRHSASCPIYGQVAQCRCGFNTALDAFDAYHAKAVAERGQP